MRGLLGSCITDLFNEERELLTAQQQQEVKTTEIQKEVATLKTDLLYVPLSKFIPDIDNAVALLSSSTCLFLPAYADINRRSNALMSFLLRINHVLGNSHPAFLPLHSDGLFTDAAQLSVYNYSADIEATDINGNNVGLSWATNSYRRAFDALLAAAKAHDLPRICLCVYFPDFDLELSANHNYLVKLLGYMPPYPGLDVFFALGFCSKSMCRAYTKEALAVALQSGAGALRGAHQGSLNSLHITCVDSDSMHYINKKLEGPKQPRRLIARDQDIIRTTTLGLRTVE